MRNSHSKDFSKKVDQEIQKEPNILNNTGEVSLGFENSKSRLNLNFEKEEVFDLEAQKVYSIDDS